MQGFTFIMCVGHVTTQQNVVFITAVHCMFRVGVLGAPKVGKTALVTRFLASDDDSDSMTVGKFAKPSSNQ